ncbi:Nif3-like dinuclear metal center hexameric protein [Parachlamydia sp. AcF125]|uniref:Nif3-like dinuclear metal center hexameric protein n=1 Tax=Parachlamydia sp. AcF125 TaxID=2795736 RepID=UPI0032D5A3CA
MTLQELSEYLETLLKIPGLVDYCPNGLQVEGHDQIKRIGIAVSASLETIQQASRLNCQALIVHHGLFWERDEFPIVGSKQKKLALLLKHGISLIAYHLPLDAHAEFGNNWKAAKDLGWLDLKPFGFFNKVPIGVRGKILPQKREAFQEKLELYYEHPAHVALGGKEMVETVGLISGGAYRSIVEAAKEKLDCFITGSFDEPTWHQAYEEKINFFALGHAATERIGPRALGEHLKCKFSVDCCFIDVFNPF